MVWTTGTTRGRNMKDTNEHNDFPRTGKKAHNEARPRSDSLIDKYPSYEADPACMVCGGEGMIWMQRAVMNHEGECVDVDFENHPCDCIFAERMTVKADPKCRACGGTGEVEEIHLADGEKVISHYACVCLRYVPMEAPKNEGERNDR